MSTLDSTFPAAAPGTRGRMLAAGVVLGSLWVLLINQLRLDWETNPQYSYGWLVPFLAAYLFWLRWPTRPAPEPLRGRWLVAGGVGLLGLLLLPIRLIAEAAPEWSAVSWTLALQVTGLTLAALAWTGGWTTVRHFAWPVCFFLVAVAWPVHFESFVTQGLMQRLAALVSEILNWWGVSAQPQGNLIRLPTGTVGVDEACSGVRSLQSMFMASLFLSELLRFPWWGRLAVVAAGLSLAVFFNILRALLLVVIAVRQGLPALERWHDPAGFTILILSFATLYGLVSLFDRPTPAPPTAGQPAASWRALPVGIIAGFGLWLVAVELGVELWYRAHEVAAGPHTRFAVNWPEKEPGFHELPLAPNVVKTLACSEGRQVAWKGEGGEQWHLFSFEWDPGRTSTLAARLHRPEVCLPASGCKLAKQWPETRVPVGNLVIPFRTLEFDYQGQSIFVFFCLWENGQAQQELPPLGVEEYDRSYRLERVRQGQRNLGQQSVEVFVQGCPDATRAMADFRARAASLLRPL